MPEKRPKDRASSDSSGNGKARVLLQARVTELEQALGRLREAQEECDWILAGEQAARATIEKANQGFDLILESITDGFVAVDRDWHISHINEIACRMLNRPRQKFLGRSLWTELPQSITDALHDRAHKAIATNQPDTLESFFATRERWYEYRLFPSQEGVYIFIQDITGKKKAEEEKGLLAAIVNYSDDAIMAVTLDGIITYWSPGAERLYGYPQAELLGQSISVIVPPELRHESQMFMELVRQVEREQGGVHFETVRVARDGRKINISVRFSLIKDARGNDLGVSVVHRDITERKKMEEVLSKLEKKEAS